MATEVVVGYVKPLQTSTQVVVSTGLNLVFNLSELQDVDGYSGQFNKYARVKTDGTGIEWVDVENQVFGRNVIQYANGATYNTYVDNGKTKYPFLRINGNNYLPTVRDGIAFTITSETITDNGDGTIIVATSGGNKTFSSFGAESVPASELSMIGLNDVDDFSTQEGKVAKVKTGGSGIEFQKIEDESIPLDTATDTIKGWFQQFFTFMKELGKQLIVSTGSTIGRSLEDRFADVVNVKDYGVVGDGVVDDTDAIISAVAAMKSGSILDLQGLNVRIVHKGDNYPIPGITHPNQTSYMAFVKLNNITIKNGKITTAVDMTSNSHEVIAFYGCQDVTIDNIHISQSCTGYPVFDNNGFETQSGVVTMRHHTDGTISKGLTITSSCKFRNHHPDGHSIGDGTNNPIHPSYAGKLNAVLFFGGFDTNNPIWMDDLLVEDGVEFYDTTARCIWCWTYRDVIIGDVVYRDCGTSPTSTCYFGVRLVHGGRNVSIGKQSFTNCYVDYGVYLTNNNGVHTPINVDIDGVQMLTCRGFGVTYLADGKNVTVGQIHMHDSPMERGVHMQIPSGFNNVENITINGISATGELGKLVDMRGDFANKITLKNIYAKATVGQNMSGIYALYVENYTSTGGSVLSIENIHIEGFQNGLYCDARTDVPLYMSNFVINNSLGDGMVFNTLACPYSRFTNGTLSGNGGRGMRLPRYSRAVNIKGENNVEELVQMGRDSILDGFDVNDGPQSTGAAIGLVSGETGWVVKNGTLRSESGNFTYGLNLPQVGHILRNDFIGNVGTIAKWATFGSTNVQYNTPTDTP